MWDSHLVERALAILGAQYDEDPLEPVLPEAERVLARLGSPDLATWASEGPTERVSALLTCHAHVVCLEEHPKCDGCELRKFCRFFRTAAQQRWKADLAPTVVDLFSGAGGASVGFMQAGFKVLMAVDFDPWAVATYRLNHPELPEERVIRQDLSQLDDAFRVRLLSLVGERGVDVVVGGPPCQGFSQAGTSGRNSARALWPETQFVNDSRNRLYRNFLTIVEWLQPRFVVMENVPAMIQIGGGSVRSQVLQDLRERGYTGPMPRIHECERYGVPQTRRRAIFLAARCDEPEFGNLHIQALRLNTLGDAIADLPPLESGTGSEVVRRAVEPTSDYARELAKGTALIHNHVARPHQDSDLILYSRLRPGESIKDRPDLRYDQTLMKYNVTRFKDTYKRQNYETLSTTVVAHLQKDGNMYIHPEQVRTYTVREAARVQSFPDDFIFCGTRTHQFRQVGNAIPPLFMRRVAAFLAYQLGVGHQSNKDQVQLVFDLTREESGK